MCTCTTQLPYVHVFFYPYLTKGLILYTFSFFDLFSFKVKRRPNFYQKQLIKKYCQKLLFFQSFRLKLFCCTLLYGLLSIMLPTKQLLYSINLMLHFKFQTPSLLAKQYGTANLPGGKCKIQFTLLLRLCDPVARLCLIFRTCVRNANLLSNTLKIQNVFVLLNISSIKRVMIKSK